MYMVIWSRHPLFAKALQSPKNLHLKFVLLALSIWNPMSSNCTYYPWQSTIFSLHCVRIQIWLYFGEFIFIYLGLFSVSVVEVYC